MQENDLCAEGFKLIAGIILSGNRKKQDYKIGVAVLTLSL